jgi:uncharacterized protein YdcH (DUF465 family)
MELQKLADGKVETSGFHIADASNSLDEQIKLTEANDALKASQPG